MVEAEILKHAGEVCGVVFKHSKEKTLYFTGDTVWYEAVQEIIDAHKPEIIVVNAGNNQSLWVVLLSWGKKIYMNCTRLPLNAKIITVHMEAVNHWGLSREELKSFIIEKGISSNCSS